MKERSPPVPTEAGEMFLVERAPNPVGCFDRLFVLTGAAHQAPVQRIVPVAGADPGPGPGGARRLRLLHFNDFHNYFTVRNRAGADRHLFAEIVARHKRALRAAAPEEIVLLLSGGDDHTGTVFDELLGWSAPEFVMDPAYRAYSAAGVDAATLGNHELDRGAEMLRIGIRADANFPILSANLYGSAFLAPSRDYFPAAIGVAKELRIGLIGLTTTVDTRVHTSIDPELAVASPIAALSNLVPALEAWVDLILVMSHCGFGDDRAERGKAGATRYLAEGDLVLARALQTLAAKPVLIVGGHTHTVLNEDGFDEATIVADVPIVQAGGQGSHLGEVEIELPPAGRVRMRARLHPLLRDGPGEIDADFQADHIAPMLARLDGRLAEELALVDADSELSPETTIRQRYAGECALANFLADALVERSRDFLGDGGVDLAFVNSTAIGTGLKPGSLSFRDWYAVLPFADCLQVADVTGAELLAILASNAQRIVRPEELGQPGRVDVRGYVSRGFLHFSRRLRYRLRLNASAATAVAQGAFLDAVELERLPRETFRVVFTNYLGAGAYGESWNGGKIGGGVPGDIAGFDLRPLPKRDLGLVLRNEIVAYIRKIGRIGKATGACLDRRLTVI
jgi:5'-nucleotidase / UDP-sugar diphosphatase